MAAQAHARENRKTSGHVIGHFVMVEETTRCPTVTDGGGIGSFWWKMLVIFILRRSILLRYTRGSEMYLTMTARVVWRVIYIPLSTELYGMTLD